MTALFAPALPADAAPVRTFADIIAELSADQERFVALVEDFEKRFEAWGERVERVAGGKV